MSQLNLTALASLTTLAIRADLQNTVIPNSQGQHFPLAASGVVIGKSYAGELQKQGLNLDEQATLSVITAIFGQLDLSKIDLSESIATLTFTVDVSEYTSKVSAALRAAKLASIKERVSCDVLDIVEQDDKVTIIGYSLVPLKDEYQALRKPISDLPARLDVLEQDTFAAFKARDFATISKLDMLKAQLSSDYAFELTLSLA